MMPIAGDRFTVCSAKLEAAIAASRSAHNAAVAARQADPDAELEAAIAASRAHDAAQRTADDADLAACLEMSKRDAKRRAPEVIEIDDDDDDAQADTGHTGASSGRPSNAATLEELRAARLRRLG